MGERSSKMQQQEQPPPPPPPQLAALPDDPFLEILARVPYKPLCRSKCVSKSWLALCSDPRTLRRSPKTLSGFFYRSRTTRVWQPARYQRHFNNVNGRGRPMVDPSLSFLPAYHDVEVVDSCNGLLLLKCQKTYSEHARDYVVCNPAIKEWTVLPDVQAMPGYHEMYLGFDPAVSSHFKVLLVVQDLEDNNVYFRTSRVGFYSSETGEWTYKRHEWNDNARGLCRPQSAFFNGTLHFITLEFSVLTVDMEGKTWRKIPTPHNFIFIGFSQGQLHATHKGFDHDTRLSVWVLKDYGGEQWELKHSICAQDLFGIHRMEYAKRYTVVAIHPESPLVFMVLRRNLMSYDMDSEKVHDICTLEDHSERPYLSYIPCFSEWLPGGGQ